MESCIFCRIAAGDAPARILFADGEIVAFHDAHPQAPVHVLVIPRRHIASLLETSEADLALLGTLMAAAVRAARETGIAEDGFRIVANAGRDGGQTVGHVHLHVLAGRKFTWPPG